MRLAHYVKSNANSETLQHCIFVDTETDEIDLGKGDTGYKLRFGWACAVHRNGKGKWAEPTWKKFTDHADFWLWAMHHCKNSGKTWLWCHNASFDYPVLDAFCHLIDLGWEVDCAIIDAPPTIIKYRCGRKTLMVVDTLNIWRMSLAELGRKCELPKLEMPSKWGNQEGDDEYCRRDVEIIKKSVCQWSDFLRDNDLGGFCPTVASQAMRTFRHRYLDDEILIDDNDVSHKLARKCYHGGRCECGFIGHLTQPVAYVDVNSMYPYVMSYAEMPLKLVGVNRFVQIHHLKKLLQQYCVCAHVRLDTTVPFAAVVREDKLCFPTGRFDAYLTTPEIEYAFQINALREVHSCASYTKGVPFRRFSLDLYQHKEQAARDGRKLEADHWKKLLNSFYGKWGQSGRKWQEVGRCDPHLFDVRADIHAQTLKQTMIRRFSGIVSVRSEDGEGAESHPAIAAHITAHARMVLWALIRKLPAEDYFYSDTDGLLVSLHGLELLSDSLDNFALGKLKHVQTFQGVRIYGCKDLILDGEQKTKGISRKADRINECTYRQLRWHSLRGLLHTGRLDTPRTTVVTKTLRRTYTKGTVLPSGFVVPLHLGEGSDGGAL